MHYVSEKAIPAFYFFFTDPATTEIYTLSLHDALPISMDRELIVAVGDLTCRYPGAPRDALVGVSRSEEHTSELQSRQYLVCRLLLEKKKNKQNRKEQDLL